MQKAPVKVKLTGTINAQPEKATLSLRSNLRAGGIGGGGTRGPVPLHMPAWECDI